MHDWEFEKLSFEEVLRDYGGPREWPGVGDIVLADIHSCSGPPCVDAYRVTAVDPEREIAAVHPIWRYYQNGSLPITPSEQDREMKYSDFRRDVRSMFPNQTIPEEDQVEEN